jgi:tryptophan 2,3-dioxygenase
MEDQSQYKRPTFSNERGVIAEQYAQLQAIHILAQARALCPLPRASHESLIQAIFQAAEIALLNLHHLMQRALSDVQAQRFGPLACKLSWARSFHTILLHLSFLPQKLGLVPETAGDGEDISILASPAYQAYAEAVKAFDQQMLATIHKRKISLLHVIGQKSLDDDQMRCIHLLRLCSHETTIWERNLRWVAVAVPVPDYAGFVVSQAMYRAVYDTMLEGDTYYTQFRGVHQIPEILTAEINDHLEMAIVQLRAKDLHRVHEHLRFLNLLSEGVLAALPPIAENLATADYHEIRENLGLTSGSHSTSIHYHLFKDLYEQLWGAFTGFLLEVDARPLASEDIQELLRAIDARRFADEQAFLLHLLANEILKLRAFINAWRELHLHFPRNAIGGDHTRSLTGSSDAVQAVKKMRDTAFLRDPVQPLLAARKLDNPARRLPALSLSDYFLSEQSLDQHLLTTTGGITKERFSDVQMRTGVFAGKSAFVPPPKREVQKPWE